MKTNLPFLDGVFTVISKNSLSILKDFLLYFFPKLYNSTFYVRPMSKFFSKV